MNSEELKMELRLITNVLTDPRIEPDHGNQLQKARRDLEVVARSGKLEGRRLFRAVEIVAKVLQDIVGRKADRR